jgi:hypothetical protein
LASESLIPLFFRRMLAPSVDTARLLDEARSQGKAFDLALSIGQDCRSRFHIDRIQRGVHFHKYAPYTGFFDSLCRDKGHGCVADLVASGFALKPADFELKKLDGAWRAYAPQYGLFFIHDFKFSSDDPLKCEMEMDRQRDNAAAKYAYKASKFINLLKSDRRALFVLGDSGQMSVAMADRICAAFRQVNPRFDFKILHLAFRSAGAAAIAHPDLLSVEVDDAAEVWSGNDAGFDAAFKGIYIEPAAPVA